MKTPAEALRNFKTAFVKASAGKLKEPHYEISFDNRRDFNFIVRNLHLLSKIGKNFNAARTHAKVSSGDMLRILREKKGWTQEELAKRSNISVANLSMLENDRVDIGKKQAEQLAEAFGVHPAIIMFPER